ncbi:MAG: hypothetical protein M3Q39_03180 [Actinomycetota bacterium]|nr:hypothetical protein [Actinomycetota bacterium]
MSDIGDVVHGILGSVVTPKLGNVVTGAAAGATKHAQCRARRDVGKDAACE